MIPTSAGAPLEEDLLNNYFRSLVNHFFKILPMRENEDKSLTTYMRSLQVELLGCKEFLVPMTTDASYLTLLSILQFLIDNPETSVQEVRREVFGAISICNRLRDTYAPEEVVG